MIFDVAYAAEIFPRLLRASSVNVEAAVAAFVLSLVGGLGLALARMSPIRVLSFAAAGVIEVVRDTPFLIQLFFIYYVLPIYGLRFEAFTTGVVALGLHFSSYTAEVYRAGIESVPRGQWEASVALNLSTARTWVRVVLPQAIPPVIPALGNYLIGMFKDTAILATIAVPELLGAARSEASVTFRSLEPTAIVAVLFLIMSLAGSTAIRFVEARLRPR